MSWKLALPLHLSPSAINSQCQYQPYPDQASSTGKPQEEMNWEGTPQRECMGGMGGTRLEGSLCLSSLHTTAGHWYSEPSPQNFPTCLLSNDVIPADQSCPSHYLLLFLLLVMAFLPSYLLILWKLISNSTSSKEEAR